MKKFLCTLGVSTFIFLGLQAQREGSISAVLKDTAANAPLNDATVTAVIASDSSLAGFARTNRDGYFSVKNLTPGNYRLLITHVGYSQVTKPFTISAGAPSINLGVIAMTVKSALLAEVTLLQEKPPVIIRNDTIEYNAGSFKTKPNAVVEDLLKKLPGVQVDKDGKIKANGEEIKKVLVDGKEFFGNDPKMATKNLPADAIDKVQVFDRKSDQSRFTGFDDGNSEKTINLTVKQDKKNGLFGKVNAGVGDKGLYQGNFNVNGFSGERQLSAIGMANNTNKQGFSFLDILNFSGAMPGPGGGRGGMQMDISTNSLPVQGAGNTEGITQTWAGGLNYNNTWQKKMDLMSSYFYNRLQTGIDERTSQQWILPGNHFTSDKLTSSNNTTESHRINLVADYKFDTSNSVRLTTSLNQQQSRYGINSRYQSVSAEGRLLNSGDAASFIGGSGYSWNSSALFRHRFAKKGRTFSANLSLNSNNNSSHGSLFSHNDYYLPDGLLQQTDTIDQTNEQENQSHAYGAVLSYTEPLSKKSLLEFNYNVNTTHSTAGKTTFDIDPFSGKYTQLNDTLTNQFVNNYTYHRPALNWRYQQKNYNFALGAGLQQASLQSSFHLMGKDSSLHRSFVNLLPNANLQYNISQYQNLRFQYSSYTTQPGISQLQPLTDNTDPLNIKAGNPDLKQEFNQRLRANYLSFDPYRHTSFFASVTSSFTHNKIVNADELGAQGQRFTRPVNANGLYSLGINTAWGFPLRKLKSKLNLNSALGHSRNVGFVNAEKNNINAWNASQEITLNYSYKEVLDLGAGMEIGWNSARYSLQPAQNIQYWNQHYSFEMNLYLAGGFSLATDMDYNRRTGLSDGYNVQALLWNAGIAKQVFKNKRGEFRLQVFDILNQNTGISRSSNQNYIEDKSYNVLKRFWQLGFTYNIRRFAGKNMAAPSRRDRDIQVIREKG